MSAVCEKCGGDAIWQNEHGIPVCVPCELRAKNERLLKALGPFAKFWGETIAELGTTVRTSLTLEIGPRTKPSWSDFRRAAAALEEAGDD